MIKIITRIFFILLAAGLVCGALYITTNNSSTSSIPSGGPQGYTEGELPSEAGGSGEFATNGNQFRNHEGGSGSSSLLSLLMKVVYIALVTIIIFLISKLISLFQRKKTISNSVPAG